MKRFVLWSLCIASACQRLLGQEDDILDIRPMREPGFWEANWHWVVPCLFLVIAIIGLLLFRVLHQKPARPLTAYEQAMKEIAEAASLKTAGDDKAFSIALSYALRNYIEAVFGIRAPELTTEEFLFKAKTHPHISDDGLKTLGSFLELCDLAKFARHAFGSEERDQLLVTAKEFVEQVQVKQHSQPQIQGGKA